MTTTILTLSFLVATYMTTGVYVGMFHYARQLEAYTDTREEEIALKVLFTIGWPFVVTAAVLNDCVEIVRGRL